jgi:lipid-binding SYLF domain-containing protein
MKAHAVAFVLTTLVVGVGLSGAALARDPVTDAHQTLALFEKTDPGIKKFVESSSGYVVFPSITKAAIGVGGANGTGVVFDHSGKPVAKARMTQVTVGVQLGAQGYSEIIFFESPKSFSDFKTGQFAVAAQASAVALANGAAGSAKFKNGVAIFTATNTGLMFEASVGGQKFTIEPLSK